jgi:hypothetical protein
MARCFYRYLLTGFFCVCVGSFIIISSTQAAEEADCAFREDEYAVMAAVLFHDNQQAPDTITGEVERQAYQSLHSVDMTGIPKQEHRLSNLTSPGHVIAEGKDQPLLADFNRQNLQGCSIDKARLASVTPRGCRVNLSPPPKFSLDGSAHAQRMTYLSRAGFDSSRIRAIIQISHVAAPEMGVGYLVYLEKSPPHGLWRVVGSVLNRRY